MRADISRFMAAALSADKRAALFLQGQQAERDKLRAQLRHQLVPKRKHDLAVIKDRQRQERHALTAKQRNAREQRTEVLRQAVNVKGRATLADARAHLRTAYTEDRAALLKRQQQERQQLKQAWAAHNTARKAAWTTYARQRAGQTTEQAAAPINAPHRARDARAAEARRADAGRGITSSKQTGRDRGLQR